MLEPRFAVTTLLGIGMALGLAGLSSGTPSPAQSQPAPAPREIHVDRSCKVLLEQSDALSEFSEDDLRNDHVICHLESVFKSHHVEESFKDGVRLRQKVTIREQEYLLQNVTPGPVVFVVEHALPDNWKIDSDPQPVKVVDNTAFFRVNAEPGQIVRLHVGQRHAVPIDDGD